MKKLPLNDFTFLNDSEIETFDLKSIPENNVYGYILEVDLHYPIDIHEDHSDLPLRQNDINL